MLKIPRKLIEKMTEVDTELQHRYSHSREEQTIIRQILEKNYQEIRQMSTFSSSYIKKWLEGRELGAVDGSLNETKGNWPYTIMFFQGLAKTVSGIEIREFDVFSPLLLETDEEINKKVMGSQKMAHLELAVAERLIAENNVKVLVLDGSLTHYEIDAKEAWQTLKNTALAKDTYLIGVTEEVGTKNLLKLEEFSSLKDKYMLDKDVLFGVLKQGEMLYLQNIQSKPKVQTAWLRPATSPAIIGVDMLNEQAEKMQEMVDLIFTLTPKEGRGIPLFLDMVDKEVRITDKLVEALVEQFIHPEVRNRLLTPKRTERLY